MNNLKGRDLEQHITILAWLHILGSSLFLLIGGFVFILLTGIGAASGDAEAVAILSVVGTAVSLLMAGLSLPGIAAGYGLLKRKSWARILALVVGILNLLNFPFGTLMGVYTIWVLMQEEAPAYFMSPKYG